MADTRTFRVVDEDGDYYEITGDPTDALNAAYRERAHLVALLATWYPSHIGHNDPDSPDWAVVTVELPTGQACWHISPDDMDLFTHVEPSRRFARRWDGHTTDEKYARIRLLTAERAKPADVVTAEQQQDGAVGHVEAFLADWPNGDVVWFATAEDVAPLTIVDLRAVLAERNALAARVAELGGEREADVRAMAAFQLASGQGFRETAAAGWALVERFADRIAALDGDTDGGAG